MPSTFERKMTFLSRNLYPVILAQETSGKHAFLYQEHKFHKRKIVGVKEFPEWHYLADLEDTQARQNSETQQKGYVEGWHHQDLCWQRIFLPEGRTLGWAPILICACFPDEVLALLAPASTSPEYIYFTPKRLLLLRAGGGSWWSYRAAHPFWLYSCWRSSFWPPLQLNVVRCLFTKVSFLLSNSAGKTAKLFGKVKLNIPQPLLGLFSPGNLYLKEAVSYSLTLLVNVCYSVFVSTTFLTHIYANS